LSGEKEKSRDANLEIMRETFAIRH